jgi:hypothetical protein
MGLFLANLSGDAIGNIAGFACIIICAALGTALGGMLGGRDRQWRKVTAVAGLFLGAISGFVLFMAIIFLTGWWPFSDGP